MPKLYAPYVNFLDNAAQNHMLRQFHDIDRCNDQNQKSSRFIQYQNQSYINMSSNDYLGLSCHPELSDRSALWAEKYGTGSGSSRLVTGNSSLFSTLETKVAALKHKASALIMGAGFQTNATILQALFNKQVLKDTPLVFTDRLNHASIHFGCAAAHISQIRYHHCDSAHLEFLLEKYKDSKQPKFIISETIFSMDGDRAPINEIAALAEKYKAVFIIDDAHAVDPSSKDCIKADIVIGTFSKAFGSYGSYVAADPEIIEYLKNRCSGLIYSTALPPPILGAIDAALDLLPNLDAERKYLKKISSIMQQELKLNSYNTGNSSSHIIPLFLKDIQQAMNIDMLFKQNNIWVSIIRPPTVPKNSTRIRFSLTSSLTEQDIAKTLSIIF